MNATIALADTEAIAATVLDAWQLYRRSQQIPFPAEKAGHLIKAQSRLFHYTEPYASGREPIDDADVDAIDDAADALVAAVEWAHGPDSGPHAAAFVAGDPGSAVAA